MTPNRSLRWFPHAVRATALGTLLVAAAAGAQTLVSELTPTGLVGDALFGGSVAIGDGIVAVGAPRDAAAGQNAGSVSLFNSFTGLSTGKLFAPTPGALELVRGYGSAVAVSDNRVVVGAPEFWNGDPTGADPSFRRGADSGTAYVHHLDGFTPTQRFEANDRTDDLGLGVAVAIDGDTILVGASERMGSGDGSAYLFDIDAGSQTHKLEPNPASSGLFGPFNGFFGRGVALDNNSALVGPTFNDYGAGQRGTALLHNAFTGARVRALSPANAQPTFFPYTIGLSVAIESSFFGTIAVMGSPADDTRGVSAGAVHVLDGVTGQERHVRTADDGTAYDQFGVSVAIDAGVIVVGAPGEGGDDDACSGGSFSCTPETLGAAYVFDAQTGLQLAKLVAPARENGQNFGASVDIYGTRVVVGAPANGPNATGAGAAYLFDISSLLPTLDADYNGNFTVDAADYTVWRDTFGSTTDLRADGNRDGVVNDLDYGVWERSYGLSYFSIGAVAVPEPSAVALTLLASGLLAARRRR